MTERVFKPVNEPAEGNLETIANENWLSLRKMADSGINELEGTFEGSFEIKGKFGPQMVHKFRGDDGILKAVYGNKILNEDIQKVREGQFVRLDSIESKQSASGFNYVALKVLVA